MSGIDECFGQCICERCKCSHNLCLDRLRCKYRTDAPRETFTNLARIVEGKECLYQVDTCLAAASRPWAGDDSQPDIRPSEEDLQMLQVLAGQVAAAIDNAWLYHELRRLNASLEEKVRARTAELGLHLVAEVAAGARVEDERNRVHGGP